MSCCSRNKSVEKAQNIITGFTYLAMGVNTDLSNKRMQFCNTCEELRGGLMCNVCGCEVHAKTRVRHESCPLNKWKPE